MSIFEVKWIIPDGNDPDRRIDALGGDNFCHPIEAAIHNVVNGIHQYRTIANGQYVWVVAAERNRRIYLKTETDYYEPNNLPALPRRRWAA